MNSLLKFGNKVENDAAKLAEAAANNATVVSDTGAGTEITAHSAAGMASAVATGIVLGAYGFI